MSCLNINRVLLAGHLTETPELKTTQNGVYFTKFGLAVNRRSKNDQEQQTDFFTIVAWKERAEFVTRCFAKGAAMYVAGSMRQNTWTDQSGNKRTSYEVLADEVQPIDSKKDVQRDPDSVPPAASPSYQTGSDSSFEDIGVDDELPF